MRDAGRTNGEPKSGIIQNALKHIATAAKDAHVDHVEQRRKHKHVEYHGVMNAEVGRRSTVASLIEYLAAVNARRQIVGSAARDARCKGQAPYKEKYDGHLVDCVAQYVVQHCTSHQWFAAAMGLAV